MILYLIKLIFYIIKFYLNQLSYKLLLLVINHNITELNSYAYKYRNISNIRKIYKELKIINTLKVYILIYILEVNFKQSINTFIV